MLATTPVTSTHPPLLAPTLPQSVSETMLMATAEVSALNLTTEYPPSGCSGGNCSYVENYNIFVIALAVIQNEVSSDCRRVATLMLAAFLVVGVLLIIPAVSQTAMAYLWIEQCTRQLGRHALSSLGNSQDSSIPREFSRKNVTDMTRTLFIYRILACFASLFVLLCSTLPQLILVVANPPREGNIDQLWGWCHFFVYMDHTTRSFATYFIVIPYTLFFWDFLFSEVVPRRKLVMKHIFKGILVSAIPIALVSAMAAVPLVMYRYDKVWNGTHEVCLSRMDGTTNFLVFDFAVTRVAPMIIIICVTGAFLIWLPRHHYGVFYEPLIFLFLMVPVVFLETTIYIACYMGRVSSLINKNFGNALLIFYAFYHISFSSTFVLATLRSVVAEIRREKKDRKRYLLGETNKNREERKDRRSLVMLGLQRQFSVVFRWRSECAEDELHLEDHVDVRKLESVKEVSPILEEVFDSDEEQQRLTQLATTHYSILQRSATFKVAASPNQNASAAPHQTNTSTVETPNMEHGRPRGISQHSDGGPARKNLRSSAGSVTRSPTSISPRTTHARHASYSKTSSLQSYSSKADNSFLPSV